MEENKITEEQIEEVVSVVDEAIEEIEEIEAVEEVEMIEEIIDEELELDEINTADEEINLIKPEEMKAFLDEYVIGQDEAKKVLSVAVYNH